MSQDQFSVYLHGDANPFYLAYFSVINEQFLTDALALLNALQATILFLRLNTHELPPYDCPPINRPIYRQWLHTGKHDSRLKLPPPSIPRFPAKHQMKP